MDPLLLRAIERILAIAISAMSIYLGYRLFIQLPNQKDSAGKMTLPGNISVFFSRVGPGVFFSLFGAAVLIVSLQHGLELDVANKENAAAESTGKIANLRVRYMGDTAEPDPDKLGSLQAAVRGTIAELNKLPTMLATEVPPSRRNDVARTIREAKLALMASVWGANWGDFAKFRNWANDRETIPPPPGIEPKAVETFRQTRE